MDTEQRNIKEHPDFLIIGGAKCGTTTLYDDLAKLDGLCLPSDKEPSILTKYDDVAKMRKAYRFHFREARPGDLCGEGSTNYTKLPLYDGVANSARQLCGSRLKLIMIMRDPLSRVYSHLSHDIAKRRITVEQIDDVVLNKPIYTALSNYAMQLRPWTETFGTSNVLCISFAEFKEDRIRTVRDVASFLGLKTTAQINLDVDRVSNRSSEILYPGKVLLRLLHAEFYRHYIRPLLNDRTRRWLRASLLPDSDVPDIRLSAAVEEVLKDRLANVENEIEQLVGKRIVINES